MQDQRTPSLSREMFEAIMSGGALPGSPGGPQIGPYGFGQATRPMGNFSRTMPFGAGPPPPGFGGALGHPAQRGQHRPPQYAQPQALPMQARSPRSFGATPSEVANLPPGWMEALFGGGSGFASPYGYGAGDPRMNGGAGGWDARAGYGSPYAGSER